MEVGAPAAIAVAHLQRGPFPFCFSVERIFDDVRDALPPDICVETLVNGRPNKGIGPRLAAALEARRGRYDVRHVLGDAHFLAWFLPARHTVLTILDCVTLERLSGWRHAAFRLLWYSWPLSRAAHVTTLSEFSRQSILRWCRYPASRISVVPPPLSPEFRHRPGRPHGEWKRVLHIGSMANKNRARAIDALAGLDVTLVTVGALSPAEDALIAEKKIRHEAHSNLSRAELVEVYRSIDVLLFPSTYEGFGMPIIEAQAVGRAVVTSNAASMPEVAGGAACLVDPFDVASIRAGLLRVLEDRDYAEGLIAAGFDNARKYRVEAVAQLYAEIYRGLAENR